MTDQKTEKLVIVIGAGASADFRHKKDDKLKIAMPTGEELVRMIGNLGKVVRIFGRERAIQIHTTWRWSSEPKEVKNKVYQLLFYTKFDIPFTRNRDLPNDILACFKKNELETTDREKELLTGIINRFKDELIDEAKKNNRDQIVPSDFFEMVANRRPDEFKTHIDFSRLAAYYQPFSIDELLDSIEKGKINIKVCGATSSKEALIKAGKELIAYFLLKAENKKVFEDFESICWYRHLRNMIITSAPKIEDIKKNLENLTIISFNYDRSLEYFLQTRLGEFYEVIKTRIFYPYGSLAEEHGTKDYGTIREEKDLFKKAREMAKNLRTIGEEGKKEEKEKIREAMKEAQKIYFLGFGFHEQNCELLGLGVDDWQIEPERIKKVTEGSIRKNVTTRTNVFYTNFDNSKKIEEKIVGIAPKFFLEVNKKKIHPSTKGVYDALLQDFNLSFN